MSEVLVWQFFNQNPYSPINCAKTLGPRRLRNIKLNHAKRRINLLPERWQNFNMKRWPVKKFTKSLAQHWKKKVSSKHIYKTCTALGRGDNSNIFSSFFVFFFFALEKILMSYYQEHSHQSYPIRCQQQLVHRHTTANGPANMYANKKRLIF